MFTQRLFSVSIFTRLRLSIGIALSSVTTFLILSFILSTTILPITIAQAHGAEFKQHITTSHGFSLYGNLKYPVHATHLDYANPEAPKGGNLRLMATGTFDSLNPYVLRGLSPWKDAPGLYVYGFGQLHDTLLAGTSSNRTSGDEPQSAYGLIAERLSYPDDLSWVQFDLRPEARFHDGHPITAEDVVFSLSLLKEHGHPSYAIPLHSVDRAEIITPQRVKFYFTEIGQRPAILRVGSMPILPAHAIQVDEFEKSGLTPLLGNGPYRVKSAQPGRQLILERVKDYWARDLWLNRGLYNFDEVTIDFYRDSLVAFEAFKAGEYDVHLEYISKNWASNFFQDRRVREAIGLLFDFEWSNRTLFNNAYQRSNTFFPNSPFAATGIPNTAQIALLKPFADILPPHTLQKAFALPVTDGSGRLRQQRHKALALLKSAGYVIHNNRLVSQQSGEPFRFELVNQKASSLERVILPFKKNLELIGIDMNVRLVDATQYKERLDKFDFDMTIHVLGQNLAPGDLPYLYFHSDQADVPGSRNLAGIKNPAVDALTVRVKNLVSFEAVKDSMQALDRVLLWEHYTIPHWYIHFHRLAWWNKFGQPKQRPDYILGTQTWWREASRPARPTTGKR
ncbi:MAG: extracellular solute-binding protein [Gammaproteobacteria bacterium]